ncbi:glutamine-hydrolyzing carbamoyl-phosphate synthase small subunit [Spirochaeta africana]|uniref:Carbamoyl phosphate synthase small chain n=1 Tax=Spirochaeta africana (strain ATCC 700263 / DSM 8902 / Z-7692) TaxID=889378 RepID=H9UKA7_SPIAZ|nr:glutamine-hydrolyzing carbamoyl-phosphate synthase small subunit [Spirochaeta africana]AFG37950.1 carbamoyl-phosphate synthase, small subunit [Spirochaeta africana DSM 8902]
MEHSRFLVLENGQVFYGKGFGGAAASVADLKGLAPAGYSGAGEVVFNTAMSGYHEVLTDPSYTGQLVVLTYPHAGNYGDMDEWGESGPENRDDIRGIKAAALIVRSLYRGPVPAGRIGLDEFLKNHSIPGITEVDTRGLTLMLRDHGSMRGMLVDAAGDELSDKDRETVLAYLRGFPDMEGRNLLADVGCSVPAIFNPTGSPRFVLLDCGSKANIVRELTARGCKVVLMPSLSSAEEILAYEPQAVLISNGPGDPAVLEQQISAVQGLIGKTGVFGICLGHQLISLAAGAKTAKMKFGHHGVNHPVRDEETGKVFVTSQNHGFTVLEDSLPEGVSVWFRNANDGTVEGIKDDSRNLRTAQFHPESSPGPDDAKWIFDRFIELAPTTVHA